MPVPPVHIAVDDGNFDMALRYDAVIRLFADRYRPDLDILEVGSGSGGVTQFLHHPVTGVDRAFERTAETTTEWLQPVHGSADDLPLADASFDVVLSLEMLEH